jgi:hypothetical protein
MSRRPTATILKLIQGDAHKDRHRTDAPKIDSAPVIPPGCVLSPEEMAVWNWLLETVAVPGVHGAGDGAAFALVARLWARKQAVDEKIVSQGLVMKSPKGKPELNPNTRLSSTLHDQLRLALADIGGTPGGRFKINGPRGAAAPGEPTSWDAID